MTKARRPLKWVVRHPLYTTDRATGEPLYIPGTYRRGSIAVTPCKRYAVLPNGQTIRNDQLIGMRHA